MTAAVGTFIRLHPSDSGRVFFFADRSSYPDRKDGEDAEMDEEELPDDKTLEYDDETLELTLPSGNVTSQKKPFTPNSFSFSLSCCS